LMPVEYRQENVNWDPIGSFPINIQLRPHG
jgi:hypothetical protein